MTWLDKKIYRIVKVAILRIWILIRGKKMAHCKFPAELQWGCVTEVVAIVRGGSIDRAKSMELVQHVSCFAGSAAEMFKTTDPDAEPLPDDADVDPLLKGYSDEYICDTLEDCVTQCRLMASDEASAINWSMLFNTIIPLLLQLLQKYIK